MAKAKANARGAGRNTGGTPKKGGRKATSKSSTTKTATNKSKPKCCADPIAVSETLPMCPTGIPCLIGRNGAGELVCWPFPINERYVKADQTQEVIYTNT